MHGFVGISYAAWDSHNIKNFWNMHLRENFGSYKGSKTLSKKQIAVGLLVSILVHVVLTVRWKFQMFYKILERKCVIWIEKVWTICWAFDEKQIHGIALVVSWKTLYKNARKDYMTIAPNVTMFSKCLCFCTNQNQDFLFGLYFCEVSDFLTK